MDKLTEALRAIDWLDPAKAGQAVQTVLAVLLVVLLAWLAQLVAARLLARLEGQIIRQQTGPGETPSEHAKRVQTLVRLLNYLGRLVLWSVALLVCLRQLGVNIAPILAGAGVVGLAVGFGAQSLVKDFIAGFFLILENQVRVGDVARINGMSGVVEKITFRAISLRDMAGALQIIPNGAVTTLANLTSGWSAYVFNLELDRREDPARAAAVLERISRELRADERFGALIQADIEIFGIDRYSGAGLILQGRIRTRPHGQWDVGREFLRRVKLAFEAEGIELAPPGGSLYMAELPPRPDALPPDAPEEGNQGLGN